MQSQVRFNRGPEKVPEKVPGGFGAKPGQVQQGSGEGSGRPWCKARSGAAGFRRRCRRRCGRLWCRARLGSTGDRGSGRLWVQSQVRFNRVPEKVPEKVWEALVQSHVRFNRICSHLTHGNPAEVFPALGFGARFRKICKMKTLRLLGIPARLIFSVTDPFWLYDQKMGRRDNRWNCHVK